MSEPELVWRLGRWIGGRHGGTAHLAWSEGELVIEVVDGRIHAIRGVDADEIARRLGTKPTGRSELLAEARALAVERGLAETRAVGSAKEILQQALRAWLSDPARSLTLATEPPAAAEGTTISVTHAVVELILADTASDLSRHVLPELDVLLRRSSSFLELYAPLRLSEEADLIVAKITGQRTAADIVAHSPHDPGEVLRLLAALIAAGMLEPVPVAAPADDHADPLVSPPPPVIEAPSRTRKQLPIAWIVGVLVVIGLLVVAATIGLRWYGTRDREAAPEAAHWAIAVDMGCEPEELQRVLATARRHPKDLRPVVAPAEGGDPCWRLVWGDFANFDAAEAALERIPAALTRDGFKPHVVALPDDAGEPPPLQRGG